MSPFPVCVLFSRLLKRFAAAEILHSVTGGFRKVPAYYDVYALAPARTVENRALHDDQGRIRFSLDLMRCSSSGG